MERDEWVNKAERREGKKERNKERKMLSNVKSGDEEGKRGIYILRRKRNLNSNGEKGVR